MALEHHRMPAWQARGPRPRPGARGGGDEPVARNARFEPAHVAATLVAVAQRLQAAATPSAAAAALGGQERRQVGEVAVESAG